MQGKKLTCIGLSDQYGAAVDFGDLTVGELIKRGYPAPEGVDLSFLLNLGIRAVPVRELPMTIIAEILAGKTIPGSESYNPQPMQSQATSPVLASLSRWYAQAIARERRDHRMRMRKLSTRSRLKDKMALLVSTTVKAMIRSDKKPEYMQVIGHLGDYDEFRILRKNRNGEYTNNDCVLWRDGSIAHNTEFHKFKKRVKTAIKQLKKTTSK